MGDAAEANRATDGVPPAVAPFPRASGVVSIPAGRGTRCAQLAYPADRIFEPDVAYTEAEVDIACRQHWQDYAALRGYLCDEGFVTRSADGSCYRRV